MNCDKCNEEIDNLMRSRAWLDDKYILCESCNSKLQDLLDESINSIVCQFIQPERSKREDSEYKYCYELYDYNQESISACNTRIDVVFSKEKAQCWVDHGINRTWHEKKVCKVFPEMRCSEHCGDTVRDK